MAALVAAGAGVPVVKHGNRAASSSVRLGRRARGARDPARPAARAGRRRDRDEVGITFCFAPVFHAALRHSAVPRRELGVPTTFNFLGPLANPARPAAQAVGVADGRMAGVIAGVLARRGVDGFVFRGDDGLDELTTTTTSQVWAIAGGEVDRAGPRPGSTSACRDRGPTDLRGGDADFNADVVRDVLAGERWAGARRRAAQRRRAIAAYDGGGGDHDGAPRRRIGQGARVRRVGSGPRAADGVGRRGRASAPRWDAGVNGRSYSSAPRENAASRSWVE